MVPRERRFPRRPIRGRRHRPLMLGDGKPELLIPVAPGTTTITAAGDIRRQLDLWWRLYGRGPSDDSEG